MRLKSIALIVAVGLAACERDSSHSARDEIARSIGPPYRTEDTSAGRAMAILLFHRVSSGSDRYDRVLHELAGLLCDDAAARDRLLSKVMAASREELARYRAVTCEGFEKGKLHAFDPGAAALLLARTNDGLRRTEKVMQARARRRALSYDVVCAMCAEENKPCLCEGRRCEPEDYSTKGLMLMEERLVCGALILNGVSYAWGQAVRDMYDRMW